MLPKNKRISRKMLPLVFRHGKVFQNNLFLARRATSEEKESRFSFSVSKKISKSAVVRNRLRRSGYRALKQFLPNIKPKTLLQFSFLRLPKNEEEVAQNIEIILKELNK